MSKKLFASKKWKKYLKSRQLYELDRLRERRIHHHESRRPKHKPSSRLPFARLNLPTEFSIINNPEETIAFLRQAIFVARNNNLELDLKNVSRISIDAIAVLIAVIQGLEHRAVKGTYPTDDQTRGILIESGFFQHVRSGRLVPAPTQGRISQEESKKVEPKVAKDLIRIGSEAIYGVAQKCRPAYRALIECMSNTHNHASGDHAKLRETETWYATVFADLQRKLVCFAFLDTGVGIFKSVRIGKLRRVYRALRIESNCDILKDILHGKVESSTGLAYRGKGLPSIYKLCQARRITKLIIVSNDVYADPVTGEYKTLKTQFPGTLLYWEV
jgi:hypothetical protein